MMDVTIDDVVAELEQLSQGWEVSSVSHGEIDDSRQDFSLRLLHGDLAAGLWSWVCHSRKKPLVVRIHDLLRGKLFPIETHMYYWTIAQVYRNWEKWVVRNYVNEHPSQLLLKMSILFSEPTTQVRLLCWWVRWLAFRISEKDIYQRLAPEVGLYIFHGQWHDHVPNRWDIDMIRG